MLINSPDCCTCLFSWYGLLIMVSGDFSQTLCKLLRWPEQLEQPKQYLSTPHLGTEVTEQKTKVVE